MHIRRNVKPSFNERPSQLFSQLKQLRKELENNFGLNGIPIPGLCVTGAVLYLDRVHTLGIKSRRQDVGTGHSDSSLRVTIGELL